MVSQLHEAIPEDVACRCGMVKALDGGSGAGLEYAAVGVAGTGIGLHLVSEVEVDAVLGQVVAVETVYM